MTDIIISFDTEDFTSSHAADAIRDTASLLTAEGVRANYCMVGLLASQLRAWGRNDVVAALGAHEVALHTYGHSLHPNISEYTDLEDFRAAHDECVRQESEAVRLIGETTGARRVFAAVPPGNCKSYVAMYAYADMGIPIYADTVCDTADGQGVYFCNMLNIQYYKSFESMFFRDDFDEDAFLDKLASRRRAVLYNHPNCILYTTYWDILNYDKENLVPFGSFREGTERDAAQTAMFYDKLRRFIVKLKNDGRFRIKTYSEIAAEEAAKGARVLTRADIPAIAAAIKDEPRDVTVGECNFSVFDIFCACRAFLLGDDSYTAGKNYGFLETPVTVDSETEVTSDEVIEAARRIDTGYFLPHMLKIGEKTAGPADLLYAMLGALAGNKRVTLGPREQLNNTSILPSLAGFSNRGTWRHSPAYEDKYLSRRLKLQGWTMRLS